MEHTTATHNKSSQKEFCQSSEQQKQEKGDS